MRDDHNGYYSDEGKAMTPERLEEIRRINMQAGRAVTADCVEVLDDAVSDLLHHTDALRAEIDHLMTALKASQDNGKVLVGYLETDRVAHAAAMSLATAAHDAAFSALKEDRDRLMEEVMKTIEVVESFKTRLADLRSHLTDIASDQKHLDAGTPEQAYWHFGYAAAMSDAVKALEINP